MTGLVSDIAFTPSVKAVQERKGSRGAYAKMDEKGGWTDVITDDLAAFIGAQDSYIANQFASRALSLGLKGGVIGLLLAGPTLWGITVMARQMEAGLLPEITLGPVHYSAVAALPLTISFIAMLTARLTVMKTLSRML